MQIDKDVFLHDEAPEPGLIDFADFWDKINFKAPAAAVRRCFRAGILKFIFVMGNDHCLRRRHTA